MHNAPSPRGKIIHRSVSLHECEIYGVIRHFDALLLITSRGQLLCYGGCAPKCIVMPTADSWTADYRCRLAETAGTSIDTNEVLAKMFIKHDSVPIVFEGSVELQCDHNLNTSSPDAVKLYIEARKARHNRTIVPYLKPDNVDSRDHEYVIRGRELLIRPRDCTIYFNALTPKVQRRLILKWYLLRATVLADIATTIFKLTLHLYRTSIHEHVSAQRCYTCSGTVRRIVL